MSLTDMRRKNAERRLERGQQSMDPQRQRELENERDAARYRWLRKQFPGDPYYVVAGSAQAWDGRGDFGRFLDAAIDAAAHGVQERLTSPSGKGDADVGMSDAEGSQP